jgi:hypothetical protein
MEGKMIAFVYKNFAAAQGACHIGLGVAAINTAKMLNANGIHSEVWGVKDENDLRLKLDGHRPKFVIISSPWIKTEEMRAICHARPHINFIMVVHSNVGFLQVDARAVAIIRESIDLEMTTHNFFLGGNCKRFSEWIRRTYNAKCDFIPNLYDITSFSKRKRSEHRGESVLRVGCFGAMRPLKNTMSAAAAALQLSNELDCELEFWVSTGRDAKAATQAYIAVKEMFANQLGKTIKENHWQTWPEFRRTISHMHLLLQPSFTESFNMVTADGIAEGVCSCVSTAIDWVPKRWIGDSDDVGDLVKVALYLLNDRHAINDGREALENYVTLGVERYRSLLKKG